MQSFKDFLTVDYTPGMPDLVSYAAMKRKRGRIGESAIAEANTIDLARDVVKNKTFKKGLDIQTANLILQVYGKVNAANKAKMEKMSPARLGAAVWKLSVKMKNESVDLSEKYEVVNVKHINDSGEDRAISYGRKKGYKDVGVIGDSPIKAMVLFQLKSEDKKDLKGAKIKGGEQVFRYATRSTVAGDIFPLIKVNLSKGMVYYLTQESSSGEIDEVKFETRGAKLKFARMISGVAESIEEASKEGKIRIIDLGNEGQRSIRKELGVDGLPNKGFQVQRMTKGKFVNQGKPYKTEREAEKVRQTGQHSFRFEGTSAQSRLDRRAAKHGLGKKSDRLKKATDFFNKPVPSYSKDELRKMGHPVEDVSFSTAVKKKPVSQMTPAEKEKDAKRRKSYKDFQKGMRKGFKSLSASCKNEDANENV